jgi:dTMP kinase
MAAAFSKLGSLLRGKFIVFDGPDGAGKSVQKQRVAEVLSEAGVAVVSCRDPGGTTIGDRIRSVLLDYDLSMMDPSCETMLFMASRAQLVAEVIRPALERGDTVLCDRFVTSTCAYQGAAGYDPRRVIELARYAVGDPPTGWPDLTIILDIDVEEGFSRIGRKASHAGKNRNADGEALLISGAKTDAMEARPIEFHRRVRKLFLEVHEYYPTPVVTIDGSGDVEAVHQKVLDCLTQQFGS